MHQLVQQGHPARQRAERALHGDGQALVHHHADQVLLVARVQKKRALGHAGALRNIRQLGAPHAVLEEQLEGRLADSLALVLLVGFAPSAFDCVPCQRRISDNKLTIVIF